MPRVYVPNKAFHDFSPAEEYGDIVFLTKGLLPLHSVNQLHKIFDKGLRHSEPSDYLLVSGPSVLSAIISSILTQKHGCINFLLYDRRKNKYRHALMEVTDEAA